MKFVQKYDRVFTGVITGLLLPFIVGLIIYFFSPGHKSLHIYIVRIVNSNILTHAISLCVFSNLIIFLIFNRLDMLRASRGVLAMTIAWAIVVFGIKFLG